MPAIRVFAVSLVAVVAAFAGGGWLERAEADPVPGEYSISLRVSGVAHPVGSQFPLNGILEHEWAGIDCSGSPAPEGCYQAAQMVVVYDPSVLDIVVLERHPSSDPKCVGALEPGAGKFLLGCQDLFGNTLSYAGVIGEVWFECLQPGTVSLTFDAAATFVARAGSGQQDVHTHTSSVECIAGTDTDGDGCEDTTELGPNVALGGRRDPNNYYDFFDVTGDRYIDFSDALDVLQLFGLPGTLAVIDRRDRVYLENELSEAADDGIDLTDVLAALFQFGDTCVAP